MDNAKKPCLNASFLIVFSKETDIEAVQSLLPAGSSVAYNPNEICVTITEVKECYDWEIDSVLTELFARCDLSHLKGIAEKFSGQIHIALWYYHYETQPAIIFEGENMQIIRQLNADLSIDPY